LAVVPAAAAPQQAAPVDDDSLSAAEAAFAAGDYRLAARLAARQANEPESCILRVRAEANFDPALAERTCSSALDRHALSPALHYLHALLLIGQGRDGEAIEELRQVIYLDRTQPLACFTLGSVLQRRGDLPAARREYRNAWRLCGRLPPDACVPLSEAECAGRLSEAAAARMEQIDAVQELQR
jgi:tetratricopeptide (TPR) repeat protein